jgi:hypothetical protein
LNQRHGTLEGLCHFLKKECDSSLPAIFLFLYFIADEQSAAYAEIRKVGRKKQKNKTDGK